MALAGTRTALAPLMLALLCATATASRLDRLRAPQAALPRSAVDALNLRSALLLRGGESEDALPEPTTAAEEADAEAPLEATPTAEASASDTSLDLGESAQLAPSAPVGCWSVISKIVSAIRELLSPTYAYAKKDSDILGDTSQTSGFAADDESWRTQRKKIHDIELGPGARKRVMRDLRRLKAAQVADEELGLEVDDCETLTDWVVKMVGAKGTVYEGEIYRIRVRFHADYPTAPPEVTFMRPAPVHEHIYSDGKICLNILYSDWDSKQDVKSVCLSLLSMMSSAKKKSRPPDNDSTVVMSQGQKTRNMQWEFHDDNC